MKANREHYNAPGIWWAWCDCSSHTSQKASDLEQKNPPEVVHRPKLSKALSCTTIEHLTSPSISLWSSSWTFASLFPQRAHLINGKVFKNPGALSPSVALGWCQRPSSVRKGAAWNRRQKPLRQWPGRENRRHLTRKVATIKVLRWLLTHRLKSPTLQVLLVLLQWATPLAYQFWGTPLWRWDSACALLKHAALLPFCRRSGPRIHHEHDIPWLCQEVFENLGLKRLPHLEHDHHPPCFQELALENRLKKWLSAALQETAPSKLFKTALLREQVSI